MGINEKVGQFEGRKQKLDEEKASLGDKKTEVSLCHFLRGVMLKVGSLLRVAG